MNRFPTPIRQLGCALLASLAVFAGTAHAQYPDRPVRIIVPFAPGGGTDLIARTLGQGMTKELGQSVIIENKPGAGTVIGTDLAAKSPPDGYTLVIATLAHAVNPSLLPKLPYANDTAFAPVTLVGRGPNVLVVRPDSPYKTVKDILDAVKAGKNLSYASQGNGTSAHLAGELFNNLAKTQLLHIPYRGAGPAMTDLRGGQVDLFFGTAAAVAGFIEQGTLRAIAVTSPEPSPAFKGVPTIASTVPGYSVESWYGFFVPAGTPAPVIAKLNAAIKKASQAPEFLQKVAQEGLTVTASDPAEFDRYVKAEEARWRKVVKENNIKSD
ncbi:MAG: tripartite tricarboxylate transporter substrate binding protein [Hydrogenophaga sp.]|jgi:tripartite-type tricarboxylate transporter receptor subunit TctC|uniref:tripartite tricarboxylate transporter substrate binding protein n=1 Tax=Hydrogenophaga sp. TaxID=1904254 RepID=UPI001D978589|nr:tripartite tricarboxylate transporter substrate binding protein [Hydrogenophaga sp.]MBW0170310.1 tripartite tricarboxylate transporter substrate binding protein [Hydrogenophaga sp.]MBW0185561.1 tripartite tricarboxylate transporter substrate binding protein [Hydrogenophaga sp.]